MSIWFVPRDAAARSMGADAVAMALELRGETVIRNGSRGMLWMEPLVERAESRHGAAGGLGEHDRRPDRGWLAR